MTFTTKDYLSQNEIFEKFYTPYNLEEKLAEFLKFGWDIKIIKDAAKYFYSVKTMNRNEMNWFVNTDIEILKECYL